MLWIALAVGIGVAVLVVIGACMVVAIGNARRITAVVPQREGRREYDALDAASDTLNFLDSG